MRIKNRDRSREVGRESHIGRRREEAYSFIEIYRQTQAAHIIRQQNNKKIHNKKELYE